MSEKRHVAMGLTDQEVVEMYRTMLEARKVDERLWLLNRSGKIPFVVSCQGHEGAQVGAAFALNTEIDWIAPYYRDAGVVLHFGMTIKDLLLAAFAKAEDPSSGGRQMPGHFGSRINRILTGSSPVTTQLPHAVGVALAGKMDGENFVTFTSLGEGSTNQGDFHEGLNFASVHKLPTIVFVENNEYAISVPIEQQYACKTIADRAVAYGITGITVDGTDPLAVYEAVKKAADRGRAGEGPTLIEALCPRILAHSSDDDQRQYRSAKEIAEVCEKDSLLLFYNYIISSGTATEEQLQNLQDEVQEEVNQATNYAEAAAYAAAESALRHVYEEGGE